MRCPHCLDSFEASSHRTNLYHLGVDDASGQWRFEYFKCPSCNKFIFYLESQLWADPKMVYPKAIARTPLPEAVKDPYRSDYIEACLVLSDSPKASAALSRRCLQNLLENIAQIKKPNLSLEIDELLASKQLPTYLADGVDAIRVVGNFAAHPIKSTNSGEVVDVEEGEAEWNLDVLEGLFDFYFVQPEKLASKRNALNQKLQDAGKPPLK
jgi:Domain of unknown function (DUF4145)